MNDLISFGGDDTPVTLPSADPELASLAAWMEKARKDPQAVQNVEREKGYASMKQPRDTRIGAQLKKHGEEAIDVNMDFNPVLKAV